MKVVSAIKVAKHFVGNRILNNGHPTDVISNNEKILTSKFFLDMWRIINAQNPFCTVYYPQTNVGVERSNLTIIASLSAYIKTPFRDWDLYTLPDLPI